MSDLPRGTTAPCQVHKVHAPPVHRCDFHHVWPVGDGGPNIPTNRVVVCPTGHVNVHALLDQYRRAAGDPGWAVRRQYTVTERELAWLGWDRIQRQTM